MQALLGVAGLVLVAAITPGPNNLVVLRAAVRAGVIGALPAIAGIAAGSVALLGAVGAGAGAAFAAEPRLRAIIGVAGCLYLAWLGIRLLRPRRNEPPAGQLPTGAPALFGFQFLNPKGWVMVLTATSAAPGVPLWQLAALFALIPLVCLLAWALLGSAISGALARPVVAVRFDRVMGALLLASAVALAADM
jgi:threonine/homoserine/homoserine lactone efflux protein